VTPTRAAAVAGVLPGLFWVVYSLFNVVLPAPPSIGPVTAVNVIYVAMLPAVVVVLSSRPLPAWPAAGLYLMFMAWVCLSLVWYDPSRDAQLAKELLIYGLFALVGAQMIVGAPVARRMFAVALAVVSVGLAVWTVWYALRTGFAYRAGVPVNPNLPATLVGPGLLMAAALYASDGGVRHRPWLLAGILAALYASLLLASRGVFLALVAGGAVVWWRLRPPFGRMRALIAGCGVVVLLAQVPSVPHAAWTGGLGLARRLAESSGLDRDASAAAQGPASSGDVALNPLAAESTALGRFGEEEVGSFNLRRDLWVRGLAYVTSGPGPFLLGGGVATSRMLAHEANPVFANMHNAYLQMWTDFGLIGLVLVGWLHARIARQLAGISGWFAAGTLGMLLFWVVLGLTVTVTDLHVYWVTLGIASTASMVPVGLAARRG